MGINKALQTNPQNTLEWHKMNNECALVLSVYYNGV